MNVLNHSHGATIVSSISCLREARYNFEGALMYLGILHLVCFSVLLWVESAERYNLIWSSFHCLKSYQIYYSTRSIRAYSR